MAVEFKVVALPTTPLSALEAELNTLGAAGWSVVATFFGSDGSHHVPGGVRPTTSTTTVVHNGASVLATQVVNQIVFILTQIV